MIGEPLERSQLSTMWLSDATKVGKIRNVLGMQPLSGVHRYAKHLSRINIIENSWHPHS